MIYLSLGSNMGRRRRWIAKALDALDADDVAVVQRSSFYRTAPVEVVDQPEFINLCCRVETSLDPHRLLDACLQVERRLGRRRGRPKGPRNVDIDVLLYDDRVIDDRRLTLPHPRLSKRAFVLVPLAEIAADFRDPRTGLRVAELLERCRDASSVVRL